MAESHSMCIDTTKLYLKRKSRSRKGYLPKKIDTMKNSSKFEEEMPYKKHDS